MLTRLELSGLKSIRNVHELTLCPLNVLIGQNGAGKSNLLSFFRLLSWMTPSPGSLQTHIGRVGGANALLHDGAKVTPQIEADITFETEKGTHQYHFCLIHAAQDTLIFTEERFRSSCNQSPTVPWVDLGSGHREAQIITRTEQGDTTAKTILWLLRQCRLYQFHDTSATARIRQRWSVDDGLYLKEDAANLAPLLYRLKESKPQHYRRIVETIRQIAPFFADFELSPGFGSLLLQWRERDTDVLFGPNQASDGTLRVMALVTLLLQPEEDLPELIILDEPELGLHPFAINVVAGLLKSASQKSQIILATQSETFINYFDPEDVIVVDRPGRETSFRRLSTEDLKEWLEEYSLSELWEKNVLGGRPGR